MLEARFQPLIVLDADGTISGSLDTLLIVIRDGQMD